MSDEKGPLIIEGKTKKVFAIVGNDGLRIIENKPAITANDDPSVTKAFASKAVSATTTTCRVFELLKIAGLPVAYQEQISPTEFISPVVRMIPLEAVGRRYAVGSMLKRQPNLARQPPMVPYYYHRLYTEFFLKTSGGKLTLTDGSVNDLGLDPQKGEEDPLIENPRNANYWSLWHTKQPAWEPGAELRRIPNLRDQLGLTAGLIEVMDTLLRQVFLVLERAWGILGLCLIDIKIEFGLSADGKLFIAAVIDNDSWRLRTSDWQELSKQVFRDQIAAKAVNLDKVEALYQRVAGLTERFAIPRQAIVFWRGSDKDDIAKSATMDWCLSGGAHPKLITCSGHKQPGKVLEELEEVLARYPQGGVIIAEVGMSNGLGPMLAARSFWPVISVPLTAKDRPEDVWSSLSCPSLVPNLTVLKEENAVWAALGILATSNPVAYMLRQMAIEDLVK